MRLIKNAQDNSFFDMTTSIPYPVSLFITHSLSIWEHWSVLFCVCRTAQRRTAAGLLIPEASLRSLVQLISSFISPWMRACRVIEAQLLLSTPTWSTLKQAIHLSCLSISQPLNYWMVIVSRYLSSLTLWILWVLHTQPQVLLEGTEGHHVTRPNGSDYL